MTVTCLDRGKDVRSDRARVVLVEDDAEMAEAMRHILLRERYDVDVFSDSREALDALRTRRAPDLILLDLWTPNMNGWQFRLEQKRDVALAQVPLIVISADRSPHAAAIDADCFLPKPVNSAALLTSMREVLAAKLEQPERELTRALAQDDWNALYLILTDLHDARAHSRLLLSSLTGPSAARAIALNVLIERAESLARLPLSRCPPHGRESNKHAPCESRAEPLAFEGVEAFLSWSRSVRFADDGSRDASEPAVTDLLAVVAAGLEDWVSARLRFSLSAEGAPLVVGERILVEQLLRNVLRNAREALAGALDPVLHIDLRVRGSEVALDISDTGCGVHTRDLARAFDPFFSTKRGHAGLGLTAARRITTRLNGRLELRTDGGSMTAHLVLPRAEERVVASLPARGRASVLLIQHPERGGSLQARLADDFHVTVASPEEAMGSVLSGARYDLVLCPLVVQGMTGISLLSALALSAPAQAARMVMLVPSDFGRATGKLLSELHVWHVSENLPGSELVTFLDGLLDLWQGLRLR